MPNRKNNIVPKKAGNVAAPPALDVRREVDLIGLDAGDAETLAAIAEAAVDLMDADARVRLAKHCERRLSVTSRVRVAVDYVLAYARTGSSGRAAKTLNIDIKSAWTDINIGLDRLPILRACHTYLTKLQDKSLVSAARDTVGKGLEGEELTKGQERLAPFVLERVARETWAPERGGSGRDKDAAKGSPASVVINIQQGDAFKSCGNLRQTIDAEMVNL